MPEFTVTISTPDGDMSTDRLEQILLDALYKESVLSRDTFQLSITGVTPESYYEELKRKHSAEIAELEKEKSETLEIIKAVAHVGIDFGYGKYELESDKIDKARVIFEALKVQEL
jgi:predicted house-cleaning noncanonical NTP pyrophosphatase (MazG superfamily)